MPLPAVKQLLLELLAQELRSDLSKEVQYNQGSLLEPVDAEAVLYVLGRGRCQ